VLKIQQRIYWCWEITILQAWLARKGARTPGINAQRWRQKASSLSLWCETVQSLNYVAPTSRMQGRDFLEAIRQSRWMRSTFYFVREPWSDLEIRKMHDQQGWSWIMLLAPNLSFKNITMLRLSRRFICNRNQKCEPTGFFDCKRALIRRKTAELSVSVSSLTSVSQDTQEMFREKFHRWM
jgi:hypothetical protein